MADPRELDAIWSRAVSDYPELGDRWGSTGRPVDSEGNTLLEPLQEYLELLKARNRQVVPQAPVAPQAPVLPQVSAEPQATTPSGLAVRDPDYWEAEQWKRRGGEIGEGLISLAKTTFPLTAIPHMLDRKKWASEALEALPEDAAWWQKGLEAFTGFLEPEMGALQAIGETTSPAHGALHYVPGFGEPEVRERYGHFRDQGHDPISAMSAALMQSEEAGEIPMWKSLVGGIFTDPFELLPGGIIAGGVRHGLRGARAGTKAARDIGKVAKVEPLALPAGPSMKALPVGRPPTQVEMRPQFTPPPKPKPFPEELGEGIQLPLAGIPIDMSGELAMQYKRAMDAIHKGSIPVDEGAEAVKPLTERQWTEAFTPILPSIQDSLGRTWVGRVPGGKNPKSKINKMSPATREKWGRWVNIGEEILSQAPAHPLDEKITRAVRKRWDEAQANGNNNPLAILIEYGERGIDNHPNFRSARSKYRRILAIQLFKSDDPIDLAKIDDYVDFKRGIQSDNVAGVLADDFIRFQRDPETRQILLNRYFVSHPITGELVAISDAPIGQMTAASRGRISAARQSANSDHFAKKTEPYHAIPTPIDEAVDPRLVQDGLLSRWVYDANWAAFGTEIQDKMKSNLMSMATRDELAGRHWSPAAKPFKTAVRHIEGLDSNHVRQLNDFQKQGTKELQDLGWVDEAGVPTEAGLGTQAVPGPLRVLWYALNTQDGGDWLSQLRLNRSATGKAFYPDNAATRNAVLRQYNNLRRLAEFEQSARIAAGSIDEFANANRRDYFYRGLEFDGKWEDIKTNIDNYSRGKPGIKKSFQLGRNPFTTEEMFRFGFKPLHWNPYTQGIISNRMGLQQRLQETILEILRSKELKMAEPYIKGSDEYQEALKNGWRPIRNAGPAFKEDKFMALPESLKHARDPDKHIRMFETEWLFPNNVADSIEDLFAPVDTLAKFMKEERRLRNYTFKLDDLIYIPKRAKLFASLFQQVELAGRFGASGTGAALYRLYTGMRLLGKGNVDDGFRQLYASVFHLSMIPVGWRNMVRANFSPKYREVLAKQMLDSTPWHLPETIDVFDVVKNRMVRTPIAGNKKLIAQWKKENPELAQLNWSNLFAHGLSTGDVTILGQTAEESISVLREVAEKQGIVSRNAPLHKVPQYIRRLEKAFRDGLFDGWYPSAIMQDVQHNIVPEMRLMHPDIGMDQLISEIVTKSNIKWSTIPKSQSYFRGIHRTALERIIFSLNEMESFGKMTTGLFRMGKGADTTFWATQWAGVFVFFALVGQAIHFTTTSLTQRKEDGSWEIDPNIGEFMPANRFIPFDADSNNTLGFGFNDEFLSPDLPVPTRSGDMAMLDLLQQFDFIFRLADAGRGIPTAQFLDNRQGTMVRALTTLQTEKDWMGRDVAEWGFLQKSLQFLYDTAAPIGAGQLAVAATRNAFKDKDLPHLSNRLGTLIEEGADIENILPSIETRLQTDGAGALGPVDMAILLQALGLNLKSVSNEGLKDKMVRNTFGEGEHPDFEGLRLHTWKDLQGHSDAPTLSSILFRDLKNAQQIKEIEERQNEGAEFWYDEFQKMIYEQGQVTKDRMADETALVNRLADNINPRIERTMPWSPSQFRDGVKQISRDARKKRENIEDIYGTDPRLLKQIMELKVEPDRSGKPLRWAIWKWHTMMKEYADPVSGNIDYKKRNEDGQTFSQAWDSEMASWDDEEAQETGGLAERFDIWQSVGSGGNHHPFVQDYYSAVRKISDSGYWQDGPEAEGDDFHRQLNSLATQLSDDKGKKYLEQGREYEQALAIWNNFLEASPEGKRYLRSHPTSWATRQIVRNMEIVRRANRHKTVMGNPELDRLLIKWFGNTPYLVENGKYYLELYLKLPSSYRKNPYSVK